MPRRTIIRLAVAAVVVATAMATIAVLSARASADQTAHTHPSSSVVMTPDDPAAADLPR